MEHYETYMQNISDDFLEELETTRDRLKDPVRQELETQYFWESENVQLERQQRMGIVQDYKFAPIKISRFTTDVRKEELAHKDGRARQSQVEGGVTGQTHWLRKLTRTIILNGKPVKKFKSDTETVVNLIKREAKPTDQVICPNCGGHGTVESFMDGCDFCGSDFVVRNSKVKVSGFSTIESVEDQINGIFAKLLRLYLVAFFSLFVFTAAPIMTLFTGSDPQSITRGFDFTTKFFFAVFRLFILMWVTGFFFMGRAKKAKFVDISTPGFIQIPNFSEEEITQELDHRLKSVLLAESEEQLSSFTDCDLRDVMMAHRDVFDLCISQITITHVRFDKGYNTFILDADVKVKLYRLKGHRVKEEYEIMHMQLSKWAGVDVKNDALLTEHQCPNCGHSINIFHGTTCQFCKTELNRHTLGWVFQKLWYEPVKNWYRILPILYVILVIIVIII